MSARDQSAPYKFVDVRKFSESNINYLKTQPTLSVPYKDKMEQMARDKAVFVLNNVVADPQKLRDGDLVEWMGIIPFGKAVKMAGSSFKVANYAFKHVASQKIPWDKVVQSTKSGPAKFMHGTDVNKITYEAWDKGSEVTN